MSLDLAADEAGGGLCSAQSRHLGTWQGGGRGENRLYLETHIKESSHFHRNVVFCHYISAATQ